MNVESIIEEVNSLNLTDCAKDIKAVFGYLPPTRDPDEVENDDGYITISWKKDRQSFALVFNGKGDVIGVHTNLDGVSVTPWKYSVDDGVSIIIATSNILIQDLISK